VTFKDLQKLVQSQAGPEQSQLLQLLGDKPFWIWNPTQHKREDIKTKGDRCFNHIIGLSRKEGIYIDGANPSFLKSLKMQWGERPDYENVKKEHRQYMKVEPINFSQEHKEMLGHCKMLLERGYICRHI